MPATTLDPQDGSQDYQDSPQDIQHAEMLATNFQATMEGAAVIPEGDRQYDLGVIQAIHLRNETLDPGKFLEEFPDSGFQASF